MRFLRFLPVVLLAALGLLPAAAQASRPHAPRIAVVASNLDSPRHLAFDRRGNLYVAEAGRGGSGPCFAGGEGPACMGATGAVTKINRWGRQYRVADHLASMANTPNNDNAIGPHGIAVLGHHVFITNGGPTEPRDAAGHRIEREALAAQDPVANLFGKVLRLRHHGRVVPVADIYAFERAVNPDATVANPEVDSNPVGLAFDRHGLVVADAGGNAIDRVDFRGRVSNVAVFPNRTVRNPFGGPDVPMQAVPTSVVVGPDGDYYVSQLTGFPFPVGGANVYRVDRRSGAVSVVAGGFTNIMDLAFGRDGTLYVLEIDHDSLLPPVGPSNEGALFAIDRHGNQRQISLPAGSLPMPGGIAVGRHHSLYVSIDSGSPGGGEVIRIRTRRH